MEQQSKRIAALDLIKGMSVIGMVIVHTLLIYANALLSFWAGELLFL
jgi:uncharacterized membrane protein